MSELQRLESAFRKADALAQQGNATAREDAVAFAAEIKRLAGSGQEGPKYPLMSQLNRGIADTAGGIADLFNPFDTPHALNPLPEGTGSATTGLTNLMSAGGIEVAEREPENALEGAFRGAGNAAGAVLPVAKSLQALSKFGGPLGQFADDAIRALATLTGTSAEVTAGGIAGAAEETAERAGLPEWAQDTAAVVAPMATFGGVTAASRLPRVTPGGTLAKTAFNQIRTAAAPYTKAGAEDVARNRMQDLAGGPERAEKLASRIDGENLLNLTPAQQTEDPRMLAVERLAAEQDPVLRERLVDRRADAQSTARSEMAGDGNPEVAQTFFETQRRAYTEALQARADEALQQSADQVQGIVSKRDPGQSGLEAASRLRATFDEARLQEKTLWEAIPFDASVGARNAKAVAQKWQAELGRAGAEDMPQLVSRLLLGDEAYGDTESVREIHRLYSKMREVARNDRAGNVTRQTRAKVADEVAEALLRDMGAVDGATEVGRQINEARAFSAALHETYDQGAPGRLLRLTRNGDQAIDPELSLTRTVGRGGTEGAVTSAQLENAGVPEAIVTDFIAGQFAKAATDAGTGAITVTGARRFMSNNKELLDRYPELRGDIRKAVLKRETAEQFAERVKARVSAEYDKRRSVTARFIDGSPADAVKSVLTSSNPTREARRLAREARKDKSGEALAGLKAAFSEHLIGQAMRTKGGQQRLRSDTLIDLLNTPKNKTALGAVFSEGELSRMRHIARELAKSERAVASTPSIGDTLSGAQGNRLIEFFLRFQAVKNAPGAGGARDLQTSQMVSNRVRDAWRALSNDRASQMIADAVTDPDLFKALLTQQGSPKLEERVLPRMLPYLVGAVSAVGVE